MKFYKLLIVLFLLFFNILTFSQDKSQVIKIKISGKVIDKISKKPLEYATVTIINTKNSKMIFGAITNDLGEFIIDANSGAYNIKIEYISFNSVTITQQNFIENTILNPIELSETTSQLNEVVVRAETSTVEIKLDKKVYNVGKDMIVKGGTANDVLNNVPSVTVDADGNVSLRGNENVKIFIDGRPSNAANIATALQQIPADAIDKIEVISNPSARYDSEGGAGILNIVIKKGKTDGFNGSIIATIGDPKNYGLQSNANFKTETFNFFSSLGFNDTKSPGNFLTDSEYFDNNRIKTSSINEKRTNERLRKGHNFNFGLELFIDKSLTWTNALNYRKSDGNNPENVFIQNNLAASSFVRNRINDQFTLAQNAEYTSNFTKKFKKEGHKLTLDVSTSKDIDNDSSTITTFITGQEANTSREATKNFITQFKTIFQTDYVLPIGKSGQFELGFKSDVNDMTSNYAVGNLDNLNNIIPNNQLTNTFKYKENIKAYYAQFGSKIQKFSYLFGLRLEDSKIDVNSVNNNQSFDKNYQNIFPSAFLTYELSDITKISVNYSRRITRPRNRFINPFSGYNSDVNIFEGNPDINPSMTNAFDFGYLTKIKKVAFSASIYYNNTNSPFQFTRRQNGNFVVTVLDGTDTVINGQVTQIIGREDIRTPVLLSTPQNLDKEIRYGFEFSINYSPTKWWKLNSNFNYFNAKVSGNYSYSLLNSNKLITESFNRDASNWFAKLNSRITLPYKIDWQINGIYTAPQNTIQGKSLEVFTLNTAFSKDILKEKATISLNVSDIFNSTKMRRAFDLQTVNSYTEMQRRVRQVNLSFTYRFNKKKEEKITKPRQDDGGDF